jgi:hypothetical protein
MRADVALRRTGRAQRVVDRLAHCLAANLHRIDRRHLRLDVTVGAQRFRDPL